MKRFIFSPCRPDALSSCRKIPSGRQAVRLSGLLLLLLLAPLSFADLHLRSGAIPTARGKSLDVPQEKGNPFLLCLVAHDENADGHDVRLALEKNGFAVLGYIPDNGFLIRGKSADLPRIKTIPDIIFVARYEARHKTAPELREGDEVSVLEAVVNQRLAPRRARHTRALADSEDILWLEPAPLFEPLCDVARAQEAMDVERAWEHLGLTGAGEILAIADTGLDTGDTNTLHEAFRGRVTGLGWGRPGLWNDSGGHGTMVAGCAVGNGLGKGSPGNQYAGVAPEAHLLFHSMDGPNGFLFADLLVESYGRGARVFSFSYVTSSSGSYDYYSALVDDFTWHHPEFLFCSGAGNSGPGPGTVFAPATAKNVLGVGGSVSRPVVDVPVSETLAELAVSQSIWNSSSRGPCNDKRIKPDIVAPACWIITTHPQWFNPENFYTTNGVWGTSLSTPYVAGCAILTRQWLREERGITNPSAALVKAILLNGAQPFVSGQTSRPNNTEGWGHVSLFPSLYTQPDMTNRFHDVKKGLRKNQEHVYEVESQPGAVVHAMLVYSDYPALSPAGKMLVNDLDLSVIAPNGTVLSVNDRTNNVEQISFLPSQPGVWHVKVRGHCVPYGPQPYALVMRSEPAGPRITSFRVADGKAEVEFFSQRGTALRTTDDLAAPKPWPLEPGAPARLRTDPVRSVEILLNPLEARRFWTPGE